MGQITKNLDSLKMGNKIIEKMASINITGNIIPMIWFKKILYPSGKPNLLAINILADIVYWYRPTEIRDEKTGEIIAYKKKFSADLLQRNYEQISKMFGCSKREATNAIICLENLGLIKRIFRTINDNGLVMSNVLFLELNPDKVLEITYQDLSISETVDNTNQSGGCHFQKGEGSLLKGGGATSKSETYTENTTNNTTNIFLKKENLIKEKNQNEILPESTTPISGGPEKNFRRGMEENFRDNNTNNNNTNINISKKEIYKERNEGKRENEISDDSNLPCPENSDTEKTVHDSSDNNTGNICKKSINNGNSNNKEIVTNQKVDNNKGTLLITGENPKERKKNSAKRKKEGETFSSIIHSYTNNEEMQELLTEFIEIRTKMNRLLTPSSFKRNLKVLDRIALEDGGDGTDEEKIKIIERTVINSWQGFYSLKSSVYSSPVMKKVHQGGEQSNKKSGKLFDEPSYDISEYENWNPIEEHKHVNTLDEMLELKKAEKRQKYVDLEIKEND